MKVQCIQDLKNIITKGEIYEVKEQFNWTVKIQCNDGKDRYLDVARFTIVEV